MSILPYRAAGGNHTEIISYLIDKGAPVNQTDKSGRTALHWSAISGHKEASHILLNKVGKAWNATVYALARVTRLRTSNGCFRAVGYR